MGEPELCGAGGNRTLTDSRPADFKSAASAVSPPPPRQKADSAPRHQPSDRGDGRDRTDDRGFADPCLNHLATSPCTRERKTGFEPVTLCLASRCSTTEPLPPVCRGPELNWGHLDFQSSALPTELPRPASLNTPILYHVAGVVKKQVHARSMLPCFRPPAPEQASLSSAHRM